MRAATRMMFMAGKGRNNDDGRSRSNETYNQGGQNGQRGGQMDGGRDERGPWRGGMEPAAMERGGMGREGMERGGWPTSEYGGWESKKRGEDEKERKRKKYEEYDDDDDEEGGGYAGRFRYRKNPRKYEEDDEDEKEVEFDELKAKKWVSQMQNGDGSTGEHFKAEHAEQLRMAHCPQCEKMEFWAAMNMMYSDYCEVAKKMNVDRPEFYAHMAKAFLMDKDAGEGKLAKYMKYIAKK